MVRSKPILPVDARGPGVRSGRGWPSMYCLMIDWCACARDGVVGRGPEVSAHVGADTAAGVFAAHRAVRPLSAARAPRLSVCASTVAVCRCVMGIASNRHRALGCRSQSVASRGRASVRSARPPMCGRGRCALILRSAGIFGPGFSPAPGCITRCWVSSWHVAAR